MNTFFAGVFNCENFVSVSQDDTDLSVRGRRARVDSTGSISFKSGTSEGLIRGGVGSGTTRGSAAGSEARFTFFVSKKKFKINNTDKFSHLRFVSFFFFESFGFFFF